MEIKKGKLYYDTVECKLFKATADNRDGCENVTDIIAVHCPTREDWDYVLSFFDNDKKGYDYETYKHESVIFLCKGTYASISYAKDRNWNVVTIDQFKEVYPPVVEQDEYSWVNNGLQDVPVKKTDIIVKSVIDKYQKRSEVGIKKYGTTLEDNKDGIEIFLTHLQEEMMDATLYIEKLKRKFSTLKKHL